MSEITPERVWFTKHQESLVGVSRKVKNTIAFQKERMKEGDLREKTKPGATLWKFFFYMNHFIDFLLLYCGKVCPNCG